MSFPLSQEYYTEDMKRRWKTMFAMGADVDWDIASELPPISPEQRGKNIHYTPLQGWHLVHAPAHVALRGSKHLTAADKQHIMALDHNKIVVTVQSGDAVQSQLDIVQPQSNRSGHYDTNKQPKSHKAHSGRLLPPLPAYTQTPADSEADVHHNGTIPTVTSSFR